MKTDNIWLQQKLLRRAAKKIACSFFPRPVRKDIYSTLLEEGPQILSLYNAEKHGDLWPWMFLNMLAIVDDSMCAMMILVVCQSKIPWQQHLARKCLESRRNRKSTVVSKPNAVLEVRSAPIPANIQAAISRNM